MKQKPSSQGAFARLKLKLRRDYKKASPHFPLVLKLLKLALQIYLYVV
jgi:hypothetical protein